MQQDNIKCALHIVHNVDHRRLLSCWCWCRTPRDPQPAQHHLTPPRAAGAAVRLLILTKGDTWIVIYFDCSFFIYIIFTRFTVFKNYIKVYKTALRKLFWHMIQFSHVIVLLILFFFCNCCEYIWRRNAPLAKDRDWPPYLLSCAGCRVTTTGARWGLLSHLGHSTQWWLMSWPAALCLQMSWTGA